MNDKRVRAILFDLDGVLVDAKEWHFEAFNRALLSFGYRALSHEDHLKRYDGLPTLKKLTLLSRIQSIDASQFAGIAETKQRSTIQLIEERCIPSQAHMDMLKSLRASGYRMAVCSNSVRASVDLLLDRAQLTPFFEFTLSNEDVKNPKPNPEIYFKALEKMGLTAEKALILEDNINGIQAAYASGAHVLEIPKIGDVRLDVILNTLAKIEDKSDGQ